MKDRDAVPYEFDMTTKSTTVDSAIVAEWLEIGKAYKNRPEGAVPPETPEAIEAMVELVTTVYGDALRELAEQ